MSSLSVNVENSSIGFDESDKKSSKKRSLEESKVQAIASERLPKKINKRVSFCNTVEVVTIPCIQEYEDYEDETCKKGELPLALWFSRSELDEEVFKLNEKFQKYVNDHRLCMTNESLRQFIDSEDN